MQECAYNFTNPIHKKKAGGAGFGYLIFDNFFRRLVFSVVACYGNNIGAWWQIAEVYGAWLVRNIFPNNSGAR